MSSPYSAGRDAPNPLRPYYISPSVGQPADSGLHQSTQPSHISPSGHSRNAFQMSSARDMFYDLDCSDYLSDASPSMADMVRALLDQALWKYTSVLLAQPFDVAKVVLQCQDISGTIASPHGGREHRPLYPDDHVYVRYKMPRQCIGVRLNSGHLRLIVQPQADSDESDPDEPSSYFTPSVSAPPPGRSPPPHSSHRSYTPSRSTPAVSSTIPLSRPHRITLLRQNSLLEVISQLWQKEGAMGVWKGTNTSFIYSVLHKTIECFTRSLLAALLSIPDPGLVPSGVLGTGALDIADSPSPWASLGIAVAAAGIAGVLLAPLDIVRTRYELIYPFSKSIANTKIIIQTNNNTNNPPSPFSRPKPPPPPDLLYSSFPPCPNPAPLSPPHPSHN
jgi:mitochondrial fusion and transport protein UGO1